MRMRSPRIAPPENGEVGSTATTPTRSPVRAVVGDQPRRRRSTCRARVAGDPDDVRRPCAGTPPPSRAGARRRRLPHASGAARSRGCLRPAPPKRAPGKGRSPSRAACETRVRLAEGVVEGHGGPSFRWAGSRGGDSRMAGRPPSILAREIRTAAQTHLTCASGRPRRVHAVVVPVLLALVAIAVAGSLAWLFLIPCPVPAGGGGGNITTEPRTLPPFARIVIEGQPDVTLVQGAAEGLAVEAPSRTRRGCAPRSATARSSSPHRTRDGGGRGSSVAGRRCPGSP